MAGIPAVFDITVLDGTDGFYVVGVREGDKAGGAVASAGDVNGDGYDDFIIGAVNATVNGVDYMGASYVVFGTGAGFPASLSLSALDGTNGFKLNGTKYNGAAGHSVAGAGDINGDGFADLIVGEAYAGYSAPGASYVVFGHAGPFAPVLDPSELNGSNGFTIHGATIVDFSGVSVSSAGDFNGDGFDDLLIGASYADPNSGTYSGAAYVVFGHAGGFAADLNLADLNGANGFAIAGVANRDNFGQAVAAAGDINGDGYGDLIVGAVDADPNGDRSGSSYVIFGTAAGQPALLGLTGLDGTNGFRLDGVQAFQASGFSVASAGDINGDGFDDLMIGAHGDDTANGAVYVVFGHAGAFDADIALASLDGTDGFKLIGAGHRENAGFSVQSAGDFNSDGFDDLIIGAPIHSGQNLYDASGAAYLVFGHAGGFAPVIDLATLDGEDGFQIAGPAEGGLLGRAVSSAGDVDGDGFDDLAIGGQGLYGYAGATVILFGRGTDAVVNYAGAGSDDIANGGTGKDILDGGGGNDILNGGLGADTMSGGLGDDSFYVDNTHDTTVENGGEGYDTVHATVTWTLAAETEQLILDGTGNIGGTGNASANVITGNSGANALDGGDGADILNGGLGSDSLAGGVGADQLYGGGDSDTLDGGANGDLLDGGIGADAMAGGAGDDSYYVDNAGDTTAENGGEGNDVVHTTVAWTLGANFETLILDGEGDLGGTGNAAANTIMGNAGANSLDGGDGDDLIKAGAGIDTVLGGLGADQILGQDGNDSLDGGDGNDRLDGGNGDDILVGGIGNDIMDGGVGIDTMNGGVGADQLNGGDGNDGLTGGDGNDVLTGGLGADAMTGGLGDDTFYVDDAGDTTIEVSGQGTDTIRATVTWTLAANLETLIQDGSANIDATGNGSANTVTGNGGNNSLDGGAGDDVIKAGLGNDTLIGGTGADILVGGGGLDTFVVTQASIHTSGAIEVDTVNDLIAAQGDKLDLSAIDADSLTAGDQAFHLVGGFTHHAGELTLSFAAGTTTLQLDVDGDGRADYRMMISGNVTGDSAGWLL